MKVIRFDVTPSLRNRANGVNEEMATSHDKSSNKAVFFGHANTPRGKRERRVLTIGMLFEKLFQSV